MIYTALGDLSHREVVLAVLAVSFARDFLGSGDCELGIITLAFSLTLNTLNFTLYCTD